MDMLPPSNHPKWKLQVDYRERGSRLLQLAKESEVFDVRTQTLRAGDYIINGRVVIERKTYADFALSIIDGRLFAQAAALTRLPERAVVLVEGPKPGIMPRVNPKALKGAVLSLAVAWRLPVVFSRNPDESLVCLEMLAEQSQAVGIRSLARCGCRPKRGNARRLFVLQGLPGVGPKLARQLLEQFGSVERVMQADEPQLAKVVGCGPQKAAAIRKVLIAAVTDQKGGLS